VIHLTPKEFLGSAQLIAATVEAKESSTKAHDYNVVAHARSVIAPDF
jgi:hypothetical protein